jgi:FixJ family two-component response regulator
MHPEYACARKGPYMSAGTPVVFVVDSDATVRESLQPLIRSAGWTARTAASAEEFLARPRAVTPGCLLVELDLPGLSGLDLQRRLQDRAELPVIFMSSRTDVRATVQAMKAGALEFFVKPYVRSVLLEALRIAVERSRESLRHEATLQTLRQRYQALTPREREVMSLVVDGRLNKQVAGELGISEITVKVHRGRLMRKMAAGSFAELVTMAGNLRRAARVEPVEPAVRAPYRHADAHLAAIA